MLVCLIIQRRLTLLCSISCRLFFTTFPHPAPSQQALNQNILDKTDSPRVRVKPNLGAPPTPDSDATYYYFTIDNHLLYMSFFKDWGPLNLAMVYKACILIHELLEVSFPLDVERATLEKAHTS